MKTIVLDKIASVTLGCGLKREARTSEEIPCERPSRRSRPFSSPVSKRK